MKTKTATPNNDDSPSAFISLNNLVALKLERESLFLIGLEGKAIASIHFASRSASAAERIKAVRDLARLLAASRTRLFELPAGFVLARVT
jgi:hypothetical protein